MIPALLTCVFVFCLYMKLNRDLSTEISGEEELPMQSTELTDLTQRIASLENRLRQLANDKT